LSGNIIQTNGEDIDVTQTFHLTSQTIFALFFVQ